jgi:hypothetical protein
VYAGNDGIFLSRFIFMKRNRNRLHNMKTFLIIAALLSVFCCLSGTALLVVGSLEEDSSQINPPTTIRSPTSATASGRWNVSSEIEDCPSLDVDEVVALSKASLSQTIPRACGGFLELNSNGTCRYVAVHPEMRSCDSGHATFRNGHSIELVSTMGPTGACTWVRRAQETVVFLSGFRRFNECHTSGAEEFGIDREEAVIERQNDSLVFRGLRFESQ